MALRVVDIKKTVRGRRDGDRYVHPRLLDASMEGPVQLALAYFQARLGRRRRDFEPELLVRFLGDPRIARCLVECLGSTYRWRAQRFAEVLEPCDLDNLARRGMHCPSDVRLHLFDAVNQEADGFLAGEHDASLSPLARRLDLTVPVLEQLFCLDAEENAVLVRVGMVPAATDLLAQYNFQVLHACIRHCHFVEFPDISAAACRALTDACAWCGVSMERDAGVVRLRNRPDSAGSLARWGQRLALALYTAAAVAPTLLKSGRARVTVGGRPTWLQFDRVTLAALTGGAGTVHSAANLPAIAGEWQRLRAAGRTGGWHLSLTAEPQVSAAGLAVPRLAVTRDDCRVILWPIAMPTDGAGARALHCAGQPVLAIRLANCASDLPAEVACVDWESGVTAIVTALDARWPAGRVDSALQALEALLVELDARGFIPEVQVAEALGCGGLDEVSFRLRGLDPTRALFLKGLGLCTPAFAAAMRRGLRRTRHPKPAA